VEKTKEGSHFLGEGESQPLEEENKGEPGAFPLEFRNRPLLEQKETGKEREFGSERVDMFKHTSLCTQRG